VHRASALNRVILTAQIAVQAGMVVHGGVVGISVRKLAPLVVAVPLPVQALSAKAVHLPRLAHETPAAAVLWAFAFMVHLITLAYLVYLSV